MPQKPHSKDFDSWNIEKQRINNKEASEKRFFHEGEIWWGSLGINIGSEQDGKNELFERPLLIIKKFHNDAVWIVPLTSEAKENRFHYQLQINRSFVILSQIRLVSPKRFFRFIEKINENEMRFIISKIKQLFPR